MHNCYVAYQLTWWYGKCSRYYKKKLLKKMVKCHNIWNCCSCLSTIWLGPTISKSKTNLGISWNNKCIWKNMPSWHSEKASHCKRNYCRLNPRISSSSFWSSSFLIFLFIFFNFTLYPGHNNVGRWNLEIYFKTLLPINTVPFLTFRRILEVLRDEWRNSTTHFVS